MNAAPTQPTPTGSPTEPQVHRGPVPIWLIILVFLLIYWGMLYFDQHGGWFSKEVYRPYISVADVQQYQPRIEGPNLVNGQKWFETVCAVCHSSDGSGKPNQAPPLAGSEWVQVENPARLIRIPLYGLNGPITVKGQQMVFASGMVNIGATIPDDDLKDLLSYIRSAWGNKAGEVKPEQIKAVRSEVGNRGPFTPEELLQVPAK